MVPPTNNNLHKTDYVLSRKYKNDHGYVTFVIINFTLSAFMTYRRILNKSSMTGGTSRAGTA
jgi:hypothetical protein